MLGSAVKRNGQEWALRAAGVQATRHHPRPAGPLLHAALCLQQVRDVARGRSTLGDGSRYCLPPEPPASASSASVVGTKPLN